MFAGPNGSGKSTLKGILSPDLLGLYINPDDLEREFKQTGSVALPQGVLCSKREVMTFFGQHPLAQNFDPVNFLRGLDLHDHRLHFESGTVNSYHASITADFLRHKLLDARVTFTFETVMSHRSKIHLLEEARALGFRTYLYFVATEDPSINVSRVKARVTMGGHSVPEGKIVERYHRSLNLLWDAVKLTNRAYIFDNSDDRHTWIAEVTEGQLLEYRAETIPAWFKRSLQERV